MLNRTGIRTIERMASRLSHHRRERLAKLFVAMSRPSGEQQPYDCPLCGYSGIFDPIFGSNALRFDSECPACHSRERHRFLKLWLDRATSGESLGSFLHFAPEACLQDELRTRCTQYRTADITPGRADLVLDMENIDLPDASVDTIMANHVLEHVDAGKALPELLRILRPGGLALLTTPVTEAWDDSYEDPSITTPEARHRHFGQADHVIFFGSDIEDRIRAAGFDLGKVVAGGAQAARYALIRGDTIYLARRPAT
ncbi:class I SAM-dependent methyltransferase [uncultured Sulfitobacter sp.]|uniref:class I SAM-dependent methyltransferase n=1 Tax=uncultured Sulfitobacter sp. TaxID=191468 RepID=UPI002625D2A4|nr:class I SAM-dependent methyltransferase [uncultured Sulfitobacter sp.]